MVDHMLRLRDLRGRRISAPREDPDVDLAIADATASALEPARPGTAGIVLAVG